jgi:hypothetical protein
VLLYERHEPIVIGQHNISLDRGADASLEVVRRVSLVKNPAPHDIVFL